MKERAPMLALKKMDRGNLEMAQIFPFCVKIRKHFQWMQRYNTEFQATNKHSLSVSVAPWGECLIDVWEIISLNPVGDSRLYCPPVSYFLEMRMMLITN